MRGLGADEAYWKGLAEGQVKVQRCSHCHHWHVPAVFRCGECGSWELQWQRVAPRGRIFSWTRTWHEFGAPKELGLPFVSVVVELDEAGGRRLMGTLAEPMAEVKIGQPVEAEIIQTTFEGETIPALRWHRTGAAA
ncbi:Zn-ribbon domain-containing OB-fold protein [Pelomonas sp. KK5]|uniref:Zn-ribbon domain-containing OB-fold protein n=1 Tax=Pelomonas sp. KK5 TaxID=1855730 RepID=UPI00097C05DE|nr:OB-fold domain-containing protein [Pelomonas sp. KK5]